MTKYTKKFWKEYTEKRSTASQYTKDFVKRMFEDKTNESKHVTWDNFYLVTGFKISDKQEANRMRNRIRILKK